ncbi:MAG TPA: TonB-dependent receptor [Candidatus Acidoferrales bacterium]|nr:TonB-dependent receptor [Candidatus Acidoferrales bacterium]
MRFIRNLLLISFVQIAVGTAMATIFGTVQGVVHDPDHRPIVGATVTLKAATSDWTRTTTSDQNGEFRIEAVPLGEYEVTVSAKGFDTLQQRITVLSGTSPVLHLPLGVAAVNTKVVVSTSIEPADTETVTPTTLVSRSEIAQTPGADRTNSLQMITDYVPGSYVTHDQLHIRGGHQVSWLIDGVPIPNTNIASNLGPQIDPKDIDYLEVQRGSYDAEYGDRTYGVFNVVPRTGWSRNNEGEVVASFGNFYQTNDEVNFGSHTDRFAYFASVNGNRSNYGLQTPVSQIAHDAENGYGGFGSIIFNKDPKDQFRFVTSLRRDYYQIPYDPNANDAENQTFNSYGLRDGQHEADAMVEFSWVRTIRDNMLLTVSPFYHYNRADYAGAPNDYPISTTDNRGSNYEGGQATFSANLPKNDVQAGFYGFAEQDSQLFRLIFNDMSNPNFSSSAPATGNLEEEFVEDKFRVMPWLTLMGGVRESHFSGGPTQSGAGARPSEDATSPRIGAAVRVPKLNWVFHGFYGHFYQAPPLVTASGPLLQYVQARSFGFIPLKGERDEEHQFGVTIPIRGWTLDADNFQTRAENFFDHNNVGESDVFFPLTIQQALIRGWELTVRSPELWRRAQVHLAYSNQVAEGEGAITGGLTDFSPPGGYFPLDHDQRNTLNIGVNANLPWRVFAATNIYYGSGFTNGAYDPVTDPHLYLPGHTTVDLSLGKSFGERFSASVNALNIANRRLLIDNSVTFGGFHYDEPREIYVEVRYKFKY